VLEGFPEDHYTVTKSSIPNEILEKDYFDKQNVSCTIKFRFWSLLNLIFTWIQYFLSCKIPVLFSLTRKVLWSCPWTSILAWKFYVFVFVLVLNLLFFFVLWFWYLLWLFYSYEIQQYCANLQISRSNTSKKQNNTIYITFFYLTWC